MDDLLVYITNNPIEVFSYLVTITIAGISLIQSWRNKRKFEQIEKESLISKVAIDFDYKVEQNDKERIVKGKITFQNRGTTNLKLVKLNFDVKDRSDELEKAFISKDASFKNPVEGINSLQLLGFNNTKQLFFTTETNKYFKVHRNDMAYVGKKTSNIRTLDLQENIKNFIEEKEKQLDQLFKNFELNKEEITSILINELLIKEIRGFQLFPQETLTQEFVCRYEGSGPVILNVEASSLRFLQRSISKGEAFKELIDTILEKKLFDEELKKQFVQLLNESLAPSAKEVIDHRKTFLLYLN